MSEKTIDEVYEEIAALFDIYGSPPPGGEEDEWNDLSQNEKSVWMNQGAEKKKYPRRPIGRI